ncbi:MAG TPA: flagellar biosynthetic protein FliO [Solirubrobacteraceae bacterium]|jgi:flagellar protein FliO/FliZ
MIKSILLSHAHRRAAILVAAGCVLVCDAPAYAFKASKSHAAGGENTPLSLPSTTSTHTSSSGPGLVRTIVGLAIVIAVIWGISWILRQVKSSRGAPPTGAGLANVATLPLGSGRALHLVRVGSDYVLVGSAEHGVIPIHRYTEEQARAAGLALAEEPVGRPRRALGSGTVAAPSRPAGEVGPHRSDPMHMPSPSSGLVERVREWTVRW